jgi:hypothetical protein
MNLLDKLKGSSILATNAFGLSKFISGSKTIASTGRASSPVTLTLGALHPQL